MSAVRTSIVALLLLAACDGDPFAAGGGGGSGGGTSVADLPGTTAPTSGSDISRHEGHNKGPDGSTQTGNGFAFRNGKINYDGTADTFTVDNLAFDGGNVYAHTNVGGDMGNDAGPARVFTAASTYEDAQTGALIDQFSYRALYGVSTSGNTEFAIVRTGAYAGYGFGGFIYNRKGGVTLPTSGQAKYTGTYGGLRDSKGAGLSYTTGDMDMSIDFNDFNADESATGNGAGIRGHITNRKIFDLDGNDITQAVLDGINDDKKPDANLTALPTLAFKVGPGVLDNNGEAQGSLNSLIVVDGGLDELEAGKYYAVVSGSAADEVAGVIVVVSTINSIEYRETGGFILYRPGP